MSGPQPAVDVLDVLAEAARKIFTAEVQARGLHGIAGTDRFWRAVAQAVRDADEPYRSPTPEAYAAAVRALERRTTAYSAACRVLERHKEAERVAYARSVQLAILARDMLQQIEAFENQADHATWAQHSETVEELRDQLAETLCDGGHGEDEPHTSFLPEEYR